MYITDMSLLFDPENKLTLQTSVEYVSAYERTFLRDGKPSWTFLEEPLRNEPNTFAVPLFSPYFEEVKDTLQKLIEGGFRYDNLGEHENVALLRSERINNEVPALVLDMEDLAIGFLLCLIPLALSIVVFFCELASPIIIHSLQATKNLLVYVYVIKVTAKIRTI